ncbi:hypothetical protein CHN50_04060 [Priestia aryabhattai]|uniref:DUF2306 domain-containing protein n=1 Tax=Bacillaceae TaxID=186817 RepID=UPI000BA16286|nr:DUF2306 domain-containing protein [Bacillus sp. CBEL-1]OZT13751.1 hypothetical protein CHN50_04060 [Priestia aryabhattai]TDB49805.1 DUF2306 domain-containing protein [Bacillus sp. CBEL-1]USY53462.1 DUF2306 domain-containing protein [Bacillus sp. 1780r2a1]
MKKLLIVLTFFIAVAWFGHTFSKNFIVDPTFTKFLQYKGSLDLLQNSIWLICLRLHIVLSLLALIIGPIAFLKSTRSKNKVIHRTVGKVYIISIFINFFPGLFVSFYATGGLISTIGFICLNVAWFYTTYQAYRTIKAKRIQLHKEWMIRSYSLTLANTTIYVVTLLLNKALQLDYILSYQVAVSISWIVNLLIAQFIVLIIKENARKKPSLT